MHQITVLGSRQLPKIEKSVEKLIHATEATMATAPTKKRISPNVRWCPPGSLKLLTDVPEKVRIQKLLSRKEVEKYWAKNRALKPWVLVYLPQFSQTERKGILFASLLLYFRVVCIFRRCDY